MKKPGVNVQVVVSEDDFDVARELNDLYSRAVGGVGAIATFIGLVRERHNDEAVSALELEHYPGMTETSIERIVEQALERWPLLDIVVIHRVGRLLPTDQIVFVQVASGHRDAAFAGASFIMDYLKTDAIFWKREAKKTGARWVEATSSDRERRSDW